jgi:hypothetical protein
MEVFRKLETKIGELYKKAPRMPEGGRKWLSSNVWWLVLIYVILASITIFWVTAATIFAGIALTAFGGALGAAVGGAVFIAAMILIAFTSITVILGALAISPLKSLRRKGWTLLFIILLIQAAEIVRSFLFNWEFFSFITSLLFVTLSGYLLFEIRDYYGKTTAPGSANLRVGTPTAPAAKTETEVKE